MAGPWYIGQPIQPHQSGGKPMLCEMDVDWSTIKCPCGVELCTRHESDATVKSFIQDHKYHTNGIMRSYPINNRAAKYGAKTEERAIH